MGAKKISKKIFPKYLTSFFPSAYNVITTKERNKMTYFKNTTVYNRYATQRGAENYISRYLSNQDNIWIEEIDSMFYVCGK